MTTTLSDFVKAYDVRGLVPQQLNIDVAHALGAAFAEVVALEEGASAVVIGHDMRPSSPELVDALARGITARGVDAILIGLASTDGLYYASGALGLPGAMFTASHNPARYNGIKFCRTGARPVGQESGLAQIRDLAQAHLDAGVSAFDGVRPGTISRRDVLADYAAFLRGLVDLSGCRPLRVTVDAGNGMGGLTVPAVLGTDSGLPGLPLTIDPMYLAGRHLPQPRGQPPRPGQPRRSPGAGPQPRRRHRHRLRRRRRPLLRRRRARRPGEPERDHRDDRQPRDRP